LLENKDLGSIWTTSGRHPGGIWEGVSTVTKWALARKLHCEANVASGYLPVSFRILPGTNSNFFRRAYYGQIWKNQQDLPVLLPDTLPGPSGYLPGCSVLHPVENLPVFLPDTLPGPSGNLPGCSIFNMHVFLKKKKLTQSFHSPQKKIICAGFL